jgi:integrase
VARRRKRGTGGISQLPSGAWRAQLALPGPGRERKSFTSRNKGDVEFWLREATRAIRAGEDPDTIRTVLADYLDDWLRETAHHVKPATLRGYRIHVERWIAPAIGRVPVMDLTPRHIRYVRDRVSDAGRSPRTAQAVLRTMRQALGQGVRDGILPRNVADGVKPPLQTPHQVVPTSPDEARAIIAAFAEHPLGPLVTVAIGTGLRLGELLGLRWADIDGHRIRITGSVRPTPRADGRGYLVERQATAKTNRSLRTLDVPAFVVTALEDVRRRQAAAGVISPYVFTADGRRERHGQAVLYDPRSVTRAFQDQLKRAGLPRMRFHDLRHATATLLLAAGVPLRVIQETLGHTNITTTAAVYAHVLPALQRDAAAKLDEALGKP